MKVKICGLTRPDDASAAEALGASYVGAVVVPGSPRRVSPERARTISRAVGIPLVLVVADLTAADAGAAAETAGARVIQLHGDEPAEVLRTLRGRGPWELWKAVRVRSRGDILDALESYGELADVLLLDGWHRGALGGTGTVFPWEVLESLRDRIPSRLRLAAAGGLSPENVAEAVARLRPDIVDVSSGVEASPGVKDPERLRRFVERALADEGGTAPNVNEPT